MLKCILRNGNFRGLKIDSQSFVYLEIEKFHDCIEHYSCIQHFDDFFYIFKQPEASP